MTSRYGPMEGRELANPEEEEYLLPPSKPTASTSSKGKGAQAAKEGAYCRLPWFGSWSATLLVWVVSTNSLIFWSLPSNTVSGKLTVVRKLWSVNQIVQEDAELHKKLEQEEQKNQELAKDAANAEEAKRKASVAENEGTSLRSQLTAARRQLEEARKETQQERERTTEQRKRADNAEGELANLRDKFAENDRLYADLRSDKERSDREAQKQKERAERLAAKLRQIRDADMPLFKDVDKMLDKN
mmetsp:Transcript_15559/g.28928  ORF Transcript_15559/g.28928 Transcript_15559/m.28928 type:complete len:244 (-) Transcript_15559:90-821(-)